MNDENMIPLDISIFVTEDDNSVYVKLSGFPCQESANDYADHLSNYLPIMLFETDVIH